MAWIIKWHGEDTLVCDLLKELGENYNIRKYADLYDLDTLKEYLK